MLDIQKYKHTVTMDRMQQTNGAKSTQQKIPTTRINTKTAVRPTRASLARRDMVQKQKQQEQQQSNKRTSLSATSANTPKTRDKNTLNNRSRHSLPAYSTKTVSPSSSLASNHNTTTGHSRHSLPASSKVRPPLNRSTTAVDRKPPVDRKTVTAAAATITTNPPVRKTTITTTAPLRPRVTPAKRSSSISNTTKEPVKKRAAWDHRGKLLDMEAALTKANKQLEELHKFKGELLEAKEDKESERKEAIQRAVVLQSEIEILEKNHGEDIESRIARQGVYHQKLKDQQVTFQQQETGMELDLKNARGIWEEARRRVDQVMQEHQVLKMKLEQMTTDTKEKQQEIDRVDMKLERYGGTLFERERNIAELQVDLDKEEKVTDTVEAKLKEAQSANLRIQAMVEKLQQT